MNSIFNYNKKNGEIIITGLQKDQTEKSIVIPDIIDGMPVTGIVDYAFCGSRITDIKMGQNIKVVGKEAFSGCKKLKSVIWNCNCDKIPDGCFCECLALTQFDFSNIKTIGKGSFKYSGLQKIHLSPNIKYVFQSAFKGCEELKKVVWDCKCDKISERCFYGCSVLTEFSFLKIKEIGNLAFLRSGLQEIYLPPNVEKVSRKAFYNCPQLKKVIWACKCNEIPESCFGLCSLLTKFDFSRIVAVENSAFAMSGLLEVHLPPNIENVSGGAFSDCTQLKTVDWNCKCDRIPERCFYGCSSVAQFDFFKVKELGEYSFSQSGLQEAYLPPNIERVSGSAFYNCAQLKNVVWKCECDSIPYRCFSNCTNLNQFDFLNIKKIGTCSFFESGLQKIHLPQNVEEIEMQAFSNCTNLNQVIWDCEYKEVPEYCFQGCSSLKQFSFSGIKKLKSNAFASSGLTSITLNKGTQVNQKCFADCNELEKIEWLSTRKITGDIFEGCKNIKEVFVSDRVKVIEGTAFISSPDAEITFV